MENRTKVVTIVAAVGVILAIFILGGSNIFTSVAGLFILLFFLLPVVLIALAVRWALKSKTDAAAEVSPEQQSANTVRTRIILAHFVIIILAGVVYAQIATKDGFVTGAWYSALALWGADLLASIVCFIIGKREFGLTFVKIFMLLLGLLPFIFFFFCLSQF